MRMSCTWRFRIPRAASFSRAVICHCAAQLSPRIWLIAGVVCHWSFWSCAPRTHCWCPEVIKCSTRLRQLELL